MGRRNQGYYDAYWANAEGTKLVKPDGTFVGAVTTKTNPDGSTSLVGPDGAILEIDENGNLIAQVNHRTGLLADLLTLDGGNGELSVPTDAVGVVRHTGVVGQAKLIGGMPLIGWCEALVAGSVTTGAGGVLTTITTATLQGAMTHSAGILSVPIPTGKRCLWEIILQSEYAANASGTHRTIKPEPEFSSGLFLNAFAQGVLPPAATGPTKFVQPMITGGNNVSGFSRLRFNASQDSGSTLALTAIGTTLIRAYIV